MNIIQIILIIILLPNLISAIKYNIEVDNVKVFPIYDYNCDKITLESYYNFTTVLLSGTSVAYACNCQQICKLYYENIDPDNSEIFIRNDCSGVDAIKIFYNRDTCEEYNSFFHKYHLSTFDQIFLTLLFFVSTLICFAALISLKYKYDQDRNRINL